MNYYVLINCNTIKIKTFMKIENDKYTLLDEGVLENGKY